MGAPYPSWPHIGAQVPCAFVFFPIQTWESQVDILGSSSFHPRPHSHVHGYVTLLLAPSHESLQPIPKVFSPKDNIILAGEVGDQLFFLVAGTVEVHSPQGHHLRTLEEGSFFGEMALFFDDAPPVIPHSMWCRSCALVHTLLPPSPVCISDLSGNVISVQHRNV